MESRFISVTNVVDLAEEVKIFLNSFILSFNHFVKDNPDLSKTSLEKCIVILTDIYAISSSPLKERLGAGINKKGKEVVYTQVDEIKNTIDHFDFLKKFSNNLPLITSKIDALSSKKTALLKSKWLILLNDAKKNPQLKVNAFLKERKLTIVPEEKNGNKLIESNKKKLMNFASSLFLEIKNVKRFKAVSLFPSLRETFTKVPQQTVSLSQESTTANLNHVFTSNVKKQLHTAYHVFLLFITDNLEMLLSLRLTCKEIYNYFADDNLWMVHVKKLKEIEPKFLIKKPTADKPESNQAYCLRVFNDMKKTPITCSHGILRLPDLYDAKFLNQHEILNLLTDSFLMQHSLAFKVTKDCNRLLEKYDISSLTSPALQLIFTINLDLNNTKGFIKAGRFDCVIEKICRLEVNLQNKGKYVIDVEYCKTSNSFSKKIEPFMSHPTLALKM